MEPMSDIETTVKRFFCRAAADRISSTTLPKVALSSPPMVSPNRRARSSVTSPSTSARGTNDRKFCVAQPPRQHHFPPELAGDACSAFR